MPSVDLSTRLKARRGAAENVDPRAPTPTTKPTPEQPAPSSRDRPTRQGARLARQHRRLASIDAKRLRLRYRVALLGVWIATTTLISAAIFAALARYTVAEAFFITTVTAVLTLPLLAHSPIPEWILQRTLRAGDQDVALATGHLSRRLASLVESTRILRLAIEASDASDSDADREVWAWISEVRELENGDRAVIEGLSLSVDGVEAALLRETETETGEGAEQRALAALKDRHLQVIAEQLEGFETALLRHNPGPYR